MADILKFPDETELTVRLSGKEWFAIILKLAGRATGEDLKFADLVEAKMLQQLKVKG